MKKGTLLGAFAVLLVLSGGLLVQRLAGSFLSQTASVTVLPVSQARPPFTPLAPFTRIAEVEAGDGPSLSWRPSRMEGLDQWPVLGDRLLFDGKEFILVAGDRFFTSSDGDIWSEIPLQLPALGRSWNSVAAWGDLVLVSSARPEVITFEKTSGSRSQFIPDIPKEGISDLRSALAVGPRGALVVFWSVRTSTIYVVAAFASPNGRDWTRLEAQPFTSQFGSVAAYTEGFLYRERIGHVWFSPDGLTWTDRFAGEELVFVSQGGFVPWKEGVLAYPDDVFRGPSASQGPYPFLDSRGKHFLPESGLPLLEGSYVGMGGGLSAGPIGIASAFVWDPHIYLAPPGGCCSRGQALTVVEFSPDGTTWSRRQHPISMVNIEWVAAGTDRVLLLGFGLDHFEIPPQNLISPIWIGFP